jgi:hypothetical protein
MQRMRKILLFVLCCAFGLAGCAHKQTPTMQSMGLQVPALAATTCNSVGGLPDSSDACTPGAARTTNAQSICHGGSTKQWRPSSSYTNALKIQQIVAYGYLDKNPKNYEEDHLISLELGGDGSNPKNLWPEPHLGKNNSFEKDKVENWLHKQICSGAITPEAAQKGIATDWRQYLPNVANVPTRASERQ